MKKTALWNNPICSVSYNKKTPVIKLTATVNNWDRLYRKDVKQKIFVGGVLCSMRLDIYIISHLR